MRITLLLVLAGCTADVSPSPPPRDASVPFASDADPADDGSSGPSPFDASASLVDAPTDVRETPDAATATGAVLGIDGEAFTIDSEEAFLLAASYYGGASATGPTIRADMERFAELGFNHVRVWAVWPIPDASASIVRRDGSVNAVRLARLERLLELARDEGITVDVTFAYGWAPVSDGGFDAYLDAIREVARALVPHRNALFDLGNERDVRDERHLEPEEVRRLADAVREIDPERLVTASNAAETERTAPANCEELLAAADIDFCAPHFLRNEVWATETERRVRSLREALDSAGYRRPIHLQEDNRRRDGAGPSKRDFITALGGAHAGGAAGWCFHTEAGFDLTSRSFFAQLDPVELDTIDELASVR